MQNQRNIIDFSQHSHSLLNFIAGICRKLKVDSTIDKYVENNIGRNPEINYGTLGTMLISMFANGYKSLHEIEEFFSDESLDLSGIFNVDLAGKRVTDDKLGLFLDKFYEINPKKILSEISANAINQYGIKVNTINFDTTSKVMWGEYETDEGKIGHIDIDFGHSKQKRNDKKQIKMALGVANGVIVDADVLSGNYDDKTFNSDKIETLENILDNTNTNKDNFYYIADSAAFSYKNIAAMNMKNLKLITKMPETTKLCKEILNDAIDKIKECSELVITNKQNKDIKYNFINKVMKYNELEINCATYYSHNLYETKVKTISKNVKKELGAIEKITKKYNKREFMCEEDAKKEIQLISKNKDIKKSKLLDININIVVSKKRLSKKECVNINEYTDIYLLQIDVSENKDKIDREITKACMFVLVSNDLYIDGEFILKEYKTQSLVENKFKQLKSSSFVNSLFVKNPKRVEALSYLLLITVMILSVVEYVVRREMKKEDETAIGTGRVKMKQPTLLAIIKMMSKLSYKIVYFDDGSVDKKLNRKLSHTEEIILRYMKLDESIFIG